MWTFCLVLHPKPFYINFEVLTLSSLSFSSHFLTRTSPVSWPRTFRFCFVCQFWPVLPLEWLFEGHPERPNSSRPPTSTILEVTRSTGTDPYRELVLDPDKTFQQDFVTYKNVVTKELRSVGSRSWTIVDMVTPTTPVVLLVAEPPVPSTQGQTVTMK